MKTLKLFSFHLLLTCLFVFCSSESVVHADTPKTEPNPEEPVVNPVDMDGPYLFHLPDGKVRVVSVAENGELKEEVLNKLPDNYSFRVFSHDKKHSFEVSIHPIIRQEWKQEAPEKLLAISDPHGNLTYFLSVLQANSVINDKYEWIYGKNHLMVNGDIFDRGDDVLPILWLMYKWDHEARVAGGAVHFLIGNHESMVLRGDLRYINDKYAKIATRLNIDYSKLFGADTELGRWIGSCNTIQIIGTDLFVHAGLSAGFYECSFSIPYVNSQFSEGVFLDKSGRENLSTHSKFLFSSSSSTVGGPGPLWYRGMVGYDGHEALDEDVLDLLLERYDVKRVIVGHTEQPDINLFYNGKVIAINVKSGNNYEKKLGRGILIEGVKTYVVNDEGTIKPL